MLVPPEDQPLQPASEELLGALELPHRLAARPQGEKQRGQSLGRTLGSSILLQQSYSRLLPGT